MKEQTLCLRCPVRSHWLLPWLLLPVLTGCQHDLRLPGNRDFQADQVDAAPQTLVPSRDLAESGPAGAEWTLPPSDPFARLRAGDQGVRLGRQGSGIFNDVRWAASAYYWTYGVTPPSLAALQAERLLPRVPLHPDGSPIPLVELTPGELPPPDAIGIELTSEGLAVRMLNPNPDVSTSNPVGAYTTTWAREFNGGWTAPPLPVSAALSADRRQVAANRTAGVPVEGITDLAPVAGGSSLVWQSDQLNERRLQVYQHSIWTMIHDFVSMHGRLPRDWEGLTGSLGWEYLPMANRLAPGAPAAELELGIAVQVHQDREELRFQLKPTADMALITVYRYTYQPAEGKFQSQEVLDWDPSEAGEWIDLIRLALPTDPV